MHGNTVTSANGYKTRDFANVVQEVREFFAVHAAEGTVAGGLHVELTGKDNANILDMARYLSDNGKEMWIRHVLVPGVTDDENDLRKMSDFIASLKTVSRVEILPYHTLGMNKYTLLGQPYSAPDKPLDNPALLDFAQQYACQKGLTATLRG